MPRVEIDGDWTTREFAGFFTAMTAIYSSLAPNYPVPLNWEGDKGEIIKWTDKNNEFLWLSNSSESDFRVVKIQYGSPGFTDFAGLGAVLREIRLFLEFLIDRRSRQNLLELEADEKRCG